MLLSELLRRCREEFPRLGSTGIPDHEAKVSALFADALRAAQLQAEGMEHALRMLEAQQMPSIHADAFVVGLSTGKVSILPVHRTLIAHGFDDRPDTSDRRFGEDREKPF